jgi:hypothetical protein
MPNAPAATPTTNATHAVKTSTRTRELSQIFARASFRNIGPAEFALRGHAQTVHERECLRSR